jgi:hypothetical protein
MSVDATTRLAKPRRRLRRIVGSLLAAAALAALGVGLLLIFGRESPSTKGDLVAPARNFPHPTEVSSRRSTSRKRSHGRPASSQLRPTASM